ncbi:MAG: pre-rRNA-processing protein esf1 [Pycnora praestabilis]|nr:MAG: pre-rRNA-processing protein esf1 [Pycnora praestabilis]
MSKPPRQKAPKDSRSSQTADPPITDPRFSNIHTDPRFRLPSKKHTHVKLDKRFAHMLRDADFSKKAAVDKYGRRLPKEKGKKDLERFYRVEGEKLGESEDDREQEEGDEDEDVRQELERVGRNYDPAREGGFSSSEEESSSGEDEEDAVVEAEEEEIFGFPNEEDQQKSDVPMGEISARLAVVNLDWDNIRAADLMAVFSSFTPTTGRILKVSVYPSEYGRERMEREEMEGPPAEIFINNNARSESLPEHSHSEEEDDDEENDEDEDEKIKKSLLKEDKGSEFDSINLRRYQLERLRYFYAVITCSSPTIAKALYDATDGTEYLTTANFFDLRFIPDSVDFDDDNPRDECDSIPDGYRPNDFVTDALQHSKVRLTWDADDGMRKEAQKRAFGGSRGEIDENDLKAYLGSDSSDNDEPEPGPAPNTSKPTTSERNVPADKLSRKEVERRRMRALLGLSETAPTPLSKSKKAAQGPVGDMQITFSSGLSISRANSAVFENEPLIEESTVEVYKRKEKERKARRKERAKATRDGGGEGTDTKEPANPKAIAEDNTDKQADLGFDDPFFTAPADDKAAASALRKEERRKKRDQRAADDAATSAQHAELELLMVDDDIKNGSKANVSHFNMNEIQRAEKRAKKQGKKGAKGHTDKGPGITTTEQDGFEMNVSDPRFASLYKSHDYAIDPTNPRFKGTKGMKALLEEGRKRRRRDEDADAGDAGKRGKKQKQGTSVEEGDGRDAGGADDLQGLVRRVKGKGRIQGS